MSNPAGMSLRFPFTGWLLHFGSDNYRLAGQRLLGSEMFQCVYLRPQNIVIAESLV